MTKSVLVADIGGTNARFALAEIETGAPRGQAKITIREGQNFRAEDFETIRDAADAYLESVALKPDEACFAVAGPIDGNEFTFTNSHWHIKRDELKSNLNLQRFDIVNDFFALAAGVNQLPKEALINVRSTTDGANGDPSAPTLVIGPGTGLGQALIVPTAQGEKVIATEGGHISFAPRTDKEIAVLQFISREHPRVSVERLLSGRGLVNIHRALCSIADTPRISLQANEITAAAIEGTYPIAIEAVEMFCGILGRVAGDAVLATGARAGVVLGGGILPKIRDLFLKSPFIELYLDKGRMESYVANVPVNLIVQEGSALYGAASVLQSSNN